MGKVDGKVIQTTLKLLPNAWMTWNRESEHSKMLGKKNTAEIERDGNYYYTLYYFRFLILVGVT